MLMKIEHNKVASITYILKENNAEGKTIESVNSDKPIEFIAGTGSLLPAFEKHILNKTTGDSFEFQLSQEEAYGVFKDELVIALKKEMFAHNGEVNEEMLAIGNQIPMQDSRGNRMNGVVKKVEDKEVTMDFNHPLAGKNLYFAGSIAQVREATYEELNPPAHQGCGCGDGDGSCSTDEQHQHQDEHDCGCGC
ncbi:MAG: peptidylprolyl isomerase [Bacteroidetes bacterium 4572_77]|nr:MAG: peptidylprolyl isomerase [Bacteroidetes bacterium 4572_77]